MNCYVMDSSGIERLNLRNIPIREEKLCTRYMSALAIGALVYIEYLVM